MENKVLTHLDITTFVDLNSRIIDAIYKYIEHKYQNVCDFWLDSWDILGDRILFEFGSDDGYIEDAVYIDEFLKNCND